ncbi:MAG: TetR family transcriptional regulator [Frankiales bacterium]|nr:TetR family transcriptional regulator [Frankiales bacterium]
MPRRAPVQHRSAVRVERMLDAAAELLDELGPDGLSTSAIAARAHVSVGSLYQFFPDKNAVSEALARRSFERFSKHLRSVEGDTWEEVVDQVIDTYVSFSRTEPGFLVLSFGGPIGQHMLDPQDDNNAVVAKGLAELVDLDLPLDVLRLAVEIGDAVLTLAFRRSKDGDPALVAEAKTAVKAYLAAHLHTRHRRA